MRGQWTRKLAAKDVVEAIFVLVLILHVVRKSGAGQVLFVVLILHVARNGGAGQVLFAVLIRQGVARKNGAGQMGAGQIPFVMLISYGNVAKAPQPLMLCERRSSARRLQQMLR
ncbi:hypothetical protein NU195Hw_g4095t1 [Hortaea werneckii]